MSELNVFLFDDLLGGEVHVGELTRTLGPRGHAVRFQYAQSWIDQTAPVPSFALDTELILAPGAYHAAAGTQHLTAAFQDCSPDRWGVILMKQREAMEAKAQRQPMRTLTSWDYLVGVSDAARMGAIRLRAKTGGPYLDDRSIAALPVTDLRSIEGVAAKIEEGKTEFTADEERWIAQLFIQGSPLGGARPKASFRDTDGSLWLAKFPSNGDTEDVGLWELIVRQIAWTAGVAMPDARAIRFSDRGHTFAVKRFDRTPAARRCYASAFNLLGATESEGRSYVEIAELIADVGATSRIDEQLEQLFRRVVFGILVGNRDDHLRNHGFLRAADGWELSPAFDINPNPAKQVHVLNIDEADPRPTIESAMETTEFYRLKRSRAEQIISDVRVAVSRWQDVAKSLGAKRSEIAAMTAAFDHNR